MSDSEEYRGMVPYPVIFPDTDSEVFSYRLPRKLGKAKAGIYEFVEAYCVDKNCDCRRNSIFVLNDKGKIAALIDFGFDPDGPMAGPFLNDLHEQSAAAEDLLALFVDLVNDHPEWVRGMYQRYRNVRKKVDRRTYRGKPFPKPEKVVRTATPPPEVDDEEIAGFLDLLEASSKTEIAGRKKSAGKNRQLPLFEGAVNHSDEMEKFIERQLRLDRQERFAESRDFQGDLRRYLLDNKASADELAALLVRLFSQNPQDEERFDAALRVLMEVMEILRVELERRRPGSEQRMIRWQEALARHVFTAGVSMDLCAAVTHMLLQARVEILPVLHEASCEKMLAEGEQDPEAFNLTPEAAVENLFQCLEELQLDSPFELFDAFLQNLAVGDAEVQVALCGAMFGAENPLIRETAALMLFHPQVEVRTGVARQLAGVDGGRITPVTLRRLIIARNWFPEESRKYIDQAIAAARKARVDCAPIARPTTMSVYASGVDGAGAQSFQIILPDGKGFVSCSLLLKLETGVADAFLIPLKGKRELKDFLALLNEETGSVEVAAAYLDGRACQSLADGARRGNVPSHWLVAIAELLGRDQWRAIAADCRRELAALRAELGAGDARQLAVEARRQALANSFDWPAQETFAASWFDDDAVVDREIETLLGKKKKNSLGGARTVVEELLNGLFQARRESWLERVTLTTLWLKAAKKPPIPWPQLFHVAEALADEKIPLRDIPLMEAVASASLAAHFSRMAEGG